jgi:hypothetical protein
MSELGSYRKKIREGEGERERVMREGERERMMREGEADSFERDSGERGRGRGRFVRGRRNGERRERAKDLRRQTARWV